VKINDLHKPMLKYQELEQNREWTRIDADALKSEPSGARPKAEVAPKNWTRPVAFAATLMKHLKSRKRHSKAFQTQAVELLLTGRTLAELAEELGVHAATLCRWKERYLIDLSLQPPDTAHLTPLQLQEELRRLRKENQKLKLHQEILKKAMGILSDLPPNSMP
jgi:transposase